MSRRDGIAVMEDCHFRDFFGANISIVSMVWDMLTANSLCPKKSHPKHLLWGTLFLKSIPKVEPRVFRCRCLHGRS
jgi:hypothetical protein